MEVIPNSFFKTEKSAWVFIASTACVAAFAGAAQFEFNQGKLEEAERFIEAMCAAHIPARELDIQSKSWRHSVVIFNYPPQSKTLWVWDPNTMSQQLGISSEEPNTLAKAWVKLVVPGEEVLAAHLRQPENAAMCSNKPAANPKANG